MNSNCYTFKKIIYDNVLLDNVEATYIIHLKDNGRLEDIQKQLKEYKPTKIVYIVFNEGYKKCKKPEFITSSVTDLVDTNLHILKHSKSMNYNNILILEDDFIFSEKIKDKFHQNNISDFLNKNSNNPYYYLLGCAPILQVPYDYYNYRPVFSGGTHAVIYNTKMRDIILSCKQEDITDWDDLGIWLMYRYAYYTPLCYQLFPDTENSKSWGVNDNFILYNIKQSGRYFLKKLNMDAKAEPGYSILYTFSKLLFLCIILFLILIIIKLTKLIWIKLKIKNILIKTSKKVKFYK